MYISKAAIKNVPIINSWGKTLNGIWMDKKLNYAEQIRDRMNFAYKTHLNLDTNKYEYSKAYNVNTKTSYKLYNTQHRWNNVSRIGFTPLHIFPEGTTTNGKDILLLRRGSFIAGKPLRPIIIRSKFKSVNSTWDTIFFKSLFFRCFLLQFFNNFEILIGPPYIPSEKEMNNPALYAYNMSILMAKMLGNKDIYFLNRHIKTKCWHPVPVLKWNFKKSYKMAKDLWKNDKTFNEYIKLIQNDQRYSHWKTHGIALQQ